MYLIELILCSLVVIFSNELRWQTLLHTAGKRHHWTMQSTAMLMTLTEAEREPDSDRQCLIVCACVLVRLGHTDHYDITVSTGNHVPQNPSFPLCSPPHSLLSLRDSVSVPHSMLPSGSRELNQFNCVFQCCCSHQQKGWSHIVFTHAADGSTENGYKKPGLIFIVLVGVTRLQWRGYAKVLIGNKDISL